MFIKRLILLTVSLMVMVLFQNCSKVDFAPSKGSSLVEKVGEDVGSDQLPDEDQDRDPAGDSNDESDDGSDDDSNDDSNDDSEDQSEDVVDEDGPGQSDEDHGNDDGGHSADVNGLNYICILEGNGKSVHVGLVDDNLDQDLNTPQAVCMSERACLEIVSQAFSVKSAARRGYCPNKNPHVISLSDDEIAAKVQERLDSN